MTTFVVDTNVAIVANGCDGCETHADIRCQLTCVQRLKSLVARETVAIDAGNLILAEYKKRLNFSGRPGVGDVFFKHVFDNQYQDGHVHRVPVTPSEDEERRGFEELPENTFDPSDRKFLAVAVVAEAVVLNATDSDWAKKAALMEELCVKVDQLCPQYASRRTRRER